MGDEEFISLGRAFLSLLASAEVEYLGSIQAKLLPHKLSFDHCATLSTRDTSLHYEHPFHADSTVDLRPSQLGTRSSKSRSESVASQSSAMETSDWRDRLAGYSTSEDRLFTNVTTSQSAHDDTEISDCHDKVRDTVELLTDNRHATISRSGNGRETSDAPHTGDNLNLLASNVMNDVTSLRLPSQTRLTSVSPSLLSSNWNGSPVNERKFTLPEEATVTHWIHSYDQLSYLYGDPFEKLRYIVEIGDSFLREDAKEFINLFCCRWDREDPWSRLPLSNPTSGGSLTERMLKSLYCAETIEYDSVVDPVRLRMARILLHHHYEQKCIDLKKDPDLSSRLSQGKGIASVAKNAILEKIYGCHDKNLSPEARERHENSLKWHKRIGKRWSYVTSHLGIGIVLTCSRGLEIHINDPKKLPDRSLMILLTYLLHGYPKGIQISRMVDPLVKCIIEGGMPITCSLAADTASDINEYRQEDEKSCPQLKDNWQPVEQPGNFVRVISV
ncbi:hypothetical protein K469DRAFT_53257 [Zopfia rhizophila CBS 207.26]|uniref:Uncharacterized protein n=1 Tax=Zopfia rhizophila CBS 207.26 TaxID=1314779 RepID=A0A6A6D9M2_9PEZI|nr:hypothetical protein K469DRAFT_53257 [Zopfia rhizophila CBS 207.26]